MWGYRHAADTRLVNVHVQRLRSKVEHDPENPEIVVTVRGVGYKAGTRPLAWEPWRPQGPVRLSRAPSGAGPSRPASCSARVLLSAVVVTLVGWLLMRQITAGLLDSKVDVVVAEAPPRARSTRSSGSRRPAAPTSTPSTQLAQLVASIVSRGAVQRLRRGAHRPDRRDRAAGSPTAAGPSHRRASTLRSVPAPAAGRTYSGGDGSPPGRYTRHRATTPDAGGTRCPAVVVGSQVTLPSDGGAYTLYYLFPLDRGAADTRAGHAGRC